MTNPCKTTIAPGDSSSSGTISRRHSLVVLVSLTSFLISLCGCSTPRLSDTQKVHISVTSGGAISVEGRPCRSSDLAARLKSLGTSPQCTIMISVPSNASEAMMKSITRELATGGYRHFIFVKPREFDVSTSQSTAGSTARKVETETKPGR